MQVIFPVIAVLGAFSIAAPIYADTVDFGGVATFTISPSADQYGLAASSAMVANGGTVTQAGVFYEGHSGKLVEDIPISFQESVTVDGITKVLTFTGDDNVAIAYDLLTIDALGPVSFGSAVLDFTASSGGMTVSPSLDADVPLTATFTAAAPEPSSLILLGTGVIAAAGALRRRRAVS